jgi:DNA-binding Xre family transcriptional regulator
MKSRLNVVLAERRMTKKELAFLMGVSDTTVWRWSTDAGIGSMRLESLERLARAVGCDPKELFS